MAKNKSASSKKSKPEVKAEPITILALKRPARPPAVEKPVVNDDIAAAVDVADHESVVSAESVTEVSVITKQPEDEKSNSLNDNLSNVALAPQSNDDPLIGTFIEVSAPWGEKVSVAIIDTYVAPSGSKWVRFNVVDEIPEGWMWEGGVKLISV
ncbi:MAG TPA: hypothetical protein VIQ31_04625 [Phormidium sp.]